MILFIVLWLLCGLITDLMVVIVDLRRQKFDPNYFDSNTCMVITALFLCGLLSLFLVCGAMLFIKVKEKKYSINFRISKLLYNIANIGINKKHKTNAERLSDLLKGNDSSIDSASDEIWNMTKLNDEFEDYHQLRDWLKEECEESKCISK